MTEPRLLSREDVEVCFKYLLSEPGRGLELYQQKLRAHIAALEADNAALLDVIATASDGECDFCEALAPNHAEHCSFGRVLATPHPGAALLEEHRKGLVRARNEGLERAAEVVLQARPGLLAGAANAAHGGDERLAMSLTERAERLETLAMFIRAMKEPEPTEPA